MRSPAAATGALDGSIRTTGSGTRCFRDRLAATGTSTIGADTGAAGGLVARAGSGALGAGSRRSLSASSAISRRELQAELLLKSRWWTEACWSAPARFPAASSARMRRSATRESSGSCAARVFHHSAALRKSRSASAPSARDSSARA